MYCKVQEEIQELSIPELRSYISKSLGWRIRQSGLDFEEVFGEILKGLAVRAKGAGAWNSERSQYTTYVYMVASCVISNETKKAARQVTGSPLRVDDGSTYVEGYSTLVTDLKTMVPLEDHVILEHLLCGQHNVERICRATGRRRVEVERSLRAIREAALGLVKS